MLFIIAFIWHASQPARTQEAVSSFPAAITLNSDALLAKSAIVYDPATGKVLYSKNAQITLPLASLTKLMTAEVVLGRLATDTEITITKKDMALSSDAGDWDLAAGDTMRLDDDVRLGLAASSNLAMAAAAGALGNGYIDDLNQTAAELGLAHTYFLNSTGLDLTEDTSGAYGSADDVAHLAATFMKQYPAYFEAGMQPSITVPVSGRPMSAAATTIPLLDIPGLIGAKTGYTDLAGGNLVAAFDVDIDHPLIAVVLGSTEAGRFTDIRTLINASRNAQE